MDNHGTRFIKDNQIRLLRRSAILPSDTDQDADVRSVALEAVTGPVPARLSLWLVNAPETVEGIVTLMASYAELFDRQDDGAAYRLADNYTQITARRAFDYLCSWLGVSLFDRLIDAYRTDHDETGGDLPTPQHPAAPRLEK